MRVVVTSDFHGQLPPDVPQCDLLLLAGDVLPPAGFGSRPSGHSGFQPFVEWLERQPAWHKIGIAGNQDYIARDREEVVRALPWTYLHNEVVEIDGVKVFGTPYSKLFGDFPFQLPDDELAAIWELIPDDVEILMVHGPAQGILDRVHDGRQEGSVSLRERIASLPRLRLLVTGHIHEAYGEQPLLRSAADPFKPEWLRCANGSYLNGGYKAGNPPIVIDL